jgi:hypothetical protein
MTYDPFQAYATLGGYSGINNPFQPPFNFNGMQNPAINPAAWNPYQPQSAYWQNPLLLAGLQQGGLQQGGLQQGGLQQGISPHSHLHQLAQQLAQQIVAQQLAAQQIAAQQSPFGAQQAQFGLQPSLLNQQGLMQPQVGQIGFGGQGISPFGQSGSPFNQIGMPLAPQSWVGQAGQMGIGQTNPVLLAHLTARALQAQGFAPGVGFQG